MKRTQSQGLPRLKANIFAGICWTCLLLALAAPLTANAGKLTIEITPLKPSDSHRAPSSQDCKWFARIKVANHDFQTPANDIVVCYRIYFQSKSVGQNKTGGPVNEEKRTITSGEGKIALIAPGRDATIETIQTGMAHHTKVTGFKIEKNKTTNYQVRTDDMMTGVWVRLYQNNQIVGEYINPTTLTNNQKWDQK